MKNRIVLKSALAICIGISTFFILLWASISYNSYNLSYYNKSYVENNISKVTGKDSKELEEISKNIIEYLKKGKEEHLTKYFNTKEITHMKDVFNLFKLMRNIRNIALIAFTLSTLVVLKNFGIRSFSNINIFGNVATLLVLGLVISLISIDFQWAFVKFHQLFFNNDLWILDPKTDLMINMLTEDFFMKMAIRIVGTFIILDTIFISGFSLLKYWRSTK